MSLFVHALHTHKRFVHARVLHTYMYMFMFVYICVCIYVCIHVCVRCTHIHTLTHTHYAYICVCAFCLYVYMYRPDDTAIAIVTDGDGNGVGCAFQERASITARRLNLNIPEKGLVCNCQLRLPCDDHHCSPPLKPHGQIQRCRAWHALEPHGNDIVRKGPWEIALSSGAAIEQVAMAHATLEELRAHASTRQIRPRVDC